MPKKPDIIVIVSDSLRQDYVSYYSGKASTVQTPNIDSLLYDGIAFENMYPEGLPTIPVRTEWVTGNGTLAGRSWQPLEDTDVTCAEILRGEGYVTAFITDVYHYFKPNQNFHRGYHEWHWIRGQEYDACHSAPAIHRKVDDYINEKFPPRWKAIVDILCRNLDNAKYATDFPCYKTFELASKWIKENSVRKEPLFLWVETFDPHEPWTPPVEYDRFKDPSYKGKDYIMPPGGDAYQYFSEDEIKRIRSLYAGEVAYVDAMIGEFIKVLKETGRYDTSLIFFLSDHGHPLADHRKFLKGGDRMYSELLKVPFGFKMPEGKFKGNRIKKLAQFPDVLPTLLDAAGFKKDTLSMQGKSLMPLIRGEVDSLRPFIITGFHEAIDRCIRTEKWSLIIRPEGQSWELYDLENDPKEKNNLINQYPEIVEELKSQLGSIYIPGLQMLKGLQAKFEIADTPVSQSKGG